MNAEASIITLVVATTIVALVAASSFALIKHWMSRTKRTNINTLKSYLEEQKKKSDSISRDGKDSAIQFSDGVLYLRSSYLGIELEALNEEPGSLEYWSLISKRLARVIKKLCENNTHASGAERIEKRIAGIKNRFHAISDLQQPEHRDTLHNMELLFNKVRSNPNNILASNRILNKVEKLISERENAALRKLHFHSAAAEKYSRDASRSIGEVENLLSASDIDISGLEAQIGEMGKIFQDDATTTKIQALIDEIKKTKHENNDLSEKVITLKSKLKQFENAAGLAKSGAYGKGTYPDPASVKQATLAIQNLSEDISSSTEEEISRLRGLLRRKLESILRLDGAINDLREEIKRKQGESQQQLLEIESLKKELLRSNACIKELESHIAQLKYSNNKLKNGDKLSDDEQRLLQNELKIVNSDIEEQPPDEQKMSVVGRFYEEAIEADSLEDLMSVLMQQIADMHGNLIATTKGNCKRISLPSQSSLPKSVAYLIDALPSGQIEEGSEGRSLRFNLKYMKGIVRASHNVATFSKNMVDISNILQATDKIIGKVSAVQTLSSMNKQKKEFQSSIKKIAYETDKELEGILFAINQSMKSHLLPILEISENEFLTPDKIAITAFKADIEKILLNDESYRTEFRKKFLQLLKDLELK